MPQSLTDILIIVAAVFLLWLVIRLFRKPIRWILKLLLNTAIGFAALFALNFFGSAVGITLGLNWINALVIGVAGFPGLVLLLLLFMPDILRSADESDKKSGKKTGKKPKRS